MIHISETIISDAGRVLNDPASSSDARSIAAEILRIGRELREQGGVALVSLPPRALADVLVEYYTPNALAGRAQSLYR